MQAEYFPNEHLLFFSEHANSDVSPLESPTFLDYQAQAW